MLKLDNKKNYYLVQSSQDIDNILSELQKHTIVALDTETTGLNVRKDKVIGYSFSFEENSGYYVPIYEWVNDQLVNVSVAGTKRLLEVIASKKLIMHNASFDTRIIKNFLGIDTLKNLFADTILMMHTLNEEGPFGLKELAVKYAKSIGFSAQDVANQEQLDLEENVKSKGGSWKKSDKEMYKADLPILAKYAASDTDLTLRLFKYFSKELEKQGLIKFFYDEEVMPLLKLVTIPMEDVGIAVFMERLIELDKSISKDITELEQKVLERIKACAHFTKFLKKRIEKEIDIKPSGSFAQAVAAYFDLPLPKNENGKYSMSAKNLQKLEDSEAKRFLLGEIPEPPYCFSICISLLEKGGEPLINISSKQQLGMLVFDVMNIPALTSTEKGAPQFNEDFIEHLAKENLVDWASDLRVYNKLLKIRGSNYLRFLEEQEDGIFYPYFKQHGTTSGRYSSNIQQLSRPLEEGADHPLIVKYTNEIRALLIPIKGHVFIDDDYASLEPVCFSDNANEPSLIEIFEKDEDFYSKIAIMTEGLQGVSANKKDKNFLKNVDPEKRQAAKSYSLGIRYGLRAGKLSRELNITKEEAQEKIDKYFKAFPNLKKSMDGYLESAKKNGYVVNKFGRVRHLPEVKEIYDYFGDDIQDYSKMFNLAKKARMSYDEIKELSKRYNNLLNNALNFPIQSTAASIVNRAAIAMAKKFIELDLDAYIIAQIHDEIVVSCAEEIKHEVAAIVQDCMENTNKLSIKLIAKPEFAYNLRDGK